MAEQTHVLVSAEILGSREADERMRPVADEKNMGWCRQLKNPYTNQAKYQPNNHKTDWAVYTFLDPL